MNQVKSILARENELKSKIILREIVGNSFLGCVKLLSYTFTGSQAVKSDLIHSVFGTVNQIFRFFTTLSSSHSLKDNYNYNYNNNYGQLYLGYNRTRHFIKMTPGIFFIASGLYNITNPISWLVNGCSEVTTLNLNPFTLSVSSK